MDFERPPDTIVVAAGAVPVGDLRAWTSDSRVEPDGTVRRVIAADAGLLVAEALGLDVDVVVGDLDSLPVERVANLGAEGVDVVRAPVAKDETDLELALTFAMTAGAQRVLVLGIDGRRFDHAIANVLLLASPDLASMQIEFVAGRDRGWIVHDSLSGPRPDHSTLSLLPAGGDAIVSTQGLMWPLDCARLVAGSPRGVSNVVDDATVSIDVHEGVVICICPPYEETDQ